MRQNSTYTFSWILIIVFAVIVSYGFTFAPQDIKKDTVNYFLTKKPKKKSPLSLSLPPFKPGTVSTTRFTVARADDKLLSNVEVYPNPITDQINLKYNLSRNSTVSVKLVDVLGNNVVTLFSQRQEPGEQAYSYPVNNKLSKGFYFIRVVAGTESVIRRISIL